jgi:LacI family transcriptional regulator
VGPIAQSVEQRTFNPWVDGSSPSGPTLKSYRFHIVLFQLREYLLLVPNKPSLRDIAKQANVSLGTVSNVLNRPTSVSEETRHKVREAIDMLGFVPNVGDSKLNRNSKLVGLILPMGQNPFYDELAQGIEDSMAKHGYRVLIAYSREDEAIELQLLNSMVEANFRGIIVTPVGVHNQVFDKFIEKNVRVGFISQVDEEPDQCSVSIDQVRGGYIGVEYLAGLGHKKILWVSGPEHHHQSNQRFVGISQAAHAFDIELSTINAPSLDFLTGEHIAPQIIAAGPLPDAIFAGNDALALGIMNYFHKVGIPVPGQVSVLGYDNVSYAESALVPLTTVSQTPYQLGWTMGSQLALEFLANDDHVHQHVVFQPKIVERSSTTQKI